MRLINLRVCRAPPVKLWTLPVLKRARCHLNLEPGYSCHTIALQSQPQLALTCVRDTLLSKRATPTEFSSLSDRWRMDERPNQFALNKWNTVALWSWDMEQANCGICKFALSSNSRSYLGDKCVDCQAKGTADAECLPEFVFILSNSRANACTHFIGTVSRNGFRHIRLARCVQTTDHGRSGGSDHGLLNSILETLIDRE
jgi:hypothetical protein